MTNDERRAILRGQHAHLRETIAGVREAARNALSRDEGRDELQTRILALTRELHGHLADEERLLEPILEKLDAWGPIRLSLLRAEHVHQRAVLSVLTGPEAWPATSLVAGRALALCDDLITDMEFEERELLSDRVLRDDVILLDASDA